MIISCEQVSKYHPDKVADQISDAIFQQYYNNDKECKCNIETMVCNKTVVVSGNATSSYNMSRKEIEDIIHNIYSNLGYEVDTIYNMITPQSTQINKAVVQKDKIMAGDQEIVIGYYNKKYLHGLPVEMEYANSIINDIHILMEADSKCPLKGDAKVLVTYDTLSDEIEHITVSVCHKEEYTLKYIKDYIKENTILKYLSCEKSINPAGIWTVGGPVADVGLTGRKIVCDSYGPRIPVGGGCFSGKDFSKIDRSGAYMARYLAKQVCDSLYSVSECKVEAGYEIGNNDVLYYNVIIPSTGDNLTSLFPQFKNLLEVNTMIKHCDCIFENGDLDFVKLSSGCHFKHIY